MFYETDNNLQNISHIKSKYFVFSGIFCRILSVPHNIVLDLNNVMDLDKNVVL